MTSRIILLLLVAVMSIGCATTKQGADKTSSSVDPYEGFNRAVFSFNSGVDDYFLKPITKGYRFVTPDFVENRVSSFFSNLLEVRNLLNSLLQGKGGQAVEHMGRFVFNSTVGIAGLFDPASNLGMEKLDGEDFGQTLGAWGVESGPFIMLPFLGPSNVRDGLSIPVDMYADPANYLENSSAKDGLTFLEVVDLRAKLLAVEKLLSGDRYVFIRDTYMQRRNYLIKDGEVKDTFGDNIKGDF